MIYISYFLFNIYFNIIDQIENVSKKFELREISDKFYQKLNRIYRNDNNPRYFFSCFKKYKIIDKPKINKCSSLPLIHNKNCKGKKQYLI